MSCCWQNLQSYSPNHCYIMYDEVKHVFISVNPNFEFREYIWKEDVWTKYNVDPNGHDDCIKKNFVDKYGDYPEENAPYLIKKHIEKYGHFSIAYLRDAILLMKKNKAIFMNKYLWLLNFDTYRHVATVKQIVNLADFGINGERAQGIFIDDNMHVIGGNFNKHIAFNPFINACNPKIEILSKTFVDDKKEMVFDHRLCKINGKIFLVGGQEIPEDDSSDIGGFGQDKIDSFDIRTKSWQSHANYKLPNALGGCSVVPALNDTAILVFGGTLNDDDDWVYNWTDDILIYDIQNKILKKSHVKMPKSFEYPQAYCVEDRYRDSIITFGFVRNFCNNLQNAHPLLLPDYLIKIILGYYWNGLVHLFGQGGHWRIDVYDLL